MSNIKLPVELRDVLNRDEIYLSDELPSKRDVQMAMATYKSDVSISEFKNKLYVDPIYSKELPVAVSTYCFMNGDWLVDEDLDDLGMPILKFTDNKSGQYIKICFINQANKLKFLSEMYTAKPVLQQFPGMNIEDVINENVLYPKKKHFMTVGVMAVSTVFSYLLYKKINKKKSQE